MSRATYNFPLERKLAHYARASAGGCLLWIGVLNRGGYGRLLWQGRNHSAHRLAYEMAIGPIPEGMKVLHRCNVPACINPDHLLLGTNADKVAMARMAKGQRNGAAKLTVEQVLAIRAAPGPHRKIAAQFSVSHQNVGLIRRRRAWTHV